jgi:propionyl-CoA synthetase
MRQIVDGEDFVVPPTIEDVTVLEDLTVALMVHPESMISAPRAETTR